MKKFLLCLILIGIITIGVTKLSTAYTGGVDIYPKYISAEVAGTPYIVHFTGTSLKANTSYYAKIRIKNAAGTFLTSTNFWTGSSWGNDSSPWTSCPQYTTDSSGNLSGWIVGRYNYTNVETDSIVIRIREVGTSINNDATIRPAITSINMTTQGGWLEGYVYSDPSLTTPYQNIIVLAKDGNGDIVGAYRTEDNTVDEGYTPNPGYFKLATIAGTIASLEFRDGNNNIVTGYVAGTPPWTITANTVTTITSPSPTVTLIWPPASDTIYSGSAKIIASLSFSQNVNSAKVYYRITCNGTQSYIANMTKGIGDTFTYDITNLRPKVLPNSYVNVDSVKAWYSSGDSAVSGSGLFYVTDITAPTISSYKLNGMETIPPFIRTTQDTISATVSDDFAGIKDVFLVYRVNHLPFTYQKMNAIGNDNYKWVLTPINGDAIDFYILAKDSLSNSDSTSIEAFVVDAQKPDVTIQPLIPANTTYEKTTTITATCSDAISGISPSTVILRWNVNGLNESSVIMTNVTGNTFTANISNVYVYRDSINYWVSASDNAGNQKISSTEYFKANDNQKPIISNAKYILGSSPSTITVTVADTFGNKIVSRISKVQVRFVNVTQSNKDSIKTMSLISGNEITGTYKGTLVTSFEDSVRYKIIAYDFAGNVDSTDWFGFKSIFDTDDPTITVLPLAGIVHTPSITFQAIMTDATSGVNPDSALVFYKKNVGNWIKLPLTQKGTTDTFFANISGLLHNDTLAYYFRCADFMNHSATSSQFGTKVIDNTPPQITVDYPNDGERYSAGGTMHIKWTATDNFGTPDSVTIKFVSTIDAIDITIVNRTENDKFYAWDIPDSVFIGSVLQPFNTANGRVVISTMDKAGNLAVDSTDGMIIIDAFPPTITHTPITDPSSATVTFEAIITDNLTGVDSAKVFYRIDGGAYNQLKMTLGNPCTATRTFADNNTVDYYISAWDGVKNLSTTPTYTFTVPSSVLVDGADIYPMYISAEDANATPYAIHFNRTKANATTPLEPSTSYYVKIRLKPATGTNYYGETWNSDSLFWCNQSKAWTSHPKYTTDANGILTGWIYGRFMRAVSETDSIQIAMRKVGSTTTLLPSVSPPVTSLDMTTAGGWLEGTVYSNPQCTTPYENIIVLAKNSSGKVIGSYKTEENNIIEGYTSNPGYFKFATIAGTNIVASLEFRDVNNNKVTGYVKTKGPWTITAGATTNIDIIVSAPIKAESDVPTSFALYQNYPNPFNPETVISYMLPGNSNQLSGNQVTSKTTDYQLPITNYQVKLSIYSITGQLVRTLVNEEQSPGYYSVKWDGKDDKGNEVTSGIYIYTIRAGEFVQSKKAVLMK